MSYVSGMKIEVEAEPHLMNPEELFNDLVKDGFSVDEAINHIVTDAIVEAKVDVMLKDNPELFIGEMEDLENGNVEVTLKRWNDKGNK
jgi:hypothetical protein